MCVIIYKPLGATNPEDKVFLTADDNNSDGWGIMVRIDGKVIIERGYGKASGRDLVEAVHKYADHEYVVHTRIGTGGEFGIGNTHPFLVHDDLWMMHNGIINIDDKAAPQMCDSYHYAKFLEETLAGRPMGIQFEIRRPEIQKWMTDHIGSSKLVFMDGTGVTIVNPDKFNAYWKDGVWFSNDSAHKERTRYAGNVLVGSSYNYGFGYDIEDQWDTDSGWDDSVGPESVDMRTHWSRTSAEWAKEDADDIWFDAMAWPSPKHLKTRSRRIRSQSDEDRNFIQVLRLTEQFGNSMDADEIARFADQEPEMTAEVVVHLMSIIAALEDAKTPKVVAKPAATVVAKPRKERRGRKQLALVKS